MKILGNAGVTTARSCTLTLHDSLTVHY